MDALRQCGSIHIAGLVTDICYLIDVQTAIWGNLCRGYLFGTAWHRPNISNLYQDYIRGGFV